MQAHSEEMQKHSGSVLQGAAADPPLSYFLLKQEVLRTLTI